MPDINAVPLSPLEAAGELCRRERQQAKALDPSPWPRRLAKFCTVFYVLFSFVAALIAATSSGTGGLAPLVWAAFFGAMMSLGIFLRLSELVFFARENHDS